MARREVGGAGGAARGGRRGCGAARGRARPEAARGPRRRAARGGARPEAAKAATGDSTFASRGQAWRAPLPLAAENGPLARADGRLPQGGQKAAAGEAEATPTARFTGRRIDSGPHGARSCLNAR
ncbi:hypothetical protein Ais01nite_67440 [Asanoa ishikariensis]|nr:hypothetical protein Ais01nite_67440 [Asanoa ishikariensis]